MPENIKLPDPSLAGTMSVEEALYKRRSVREYSKKALTLQQASQLLWASYGVTEISRRGRELKTAPSAGATYPLEIYLMAGNVEGLSPGLYRYLPSTHSLQAERLGDFRPGAEDASYNQEMIEDAPATIVFSAVYERTTSRYGQRGRDRYVCMDLGHSAQNLYLQTTAMGLITCAIGAFDDAAMQGVLQLPKEEEILYLMPVGYRAQ